MYQNKKYKYNWDINVIGWKYKNEKKKKKDKPVSKTVFEWFYVTCSWLRW